jgi:hypothetical protein
MEMGNATALAAAGEREERPQLQPHTRIDWRTGRPMLVRGAAFWQEHAARRIEQGLSVTAYCEANGLAKSTFRRYASANKAGPQRTAAQAQPGAPAATAEAMVVELETGEGLKLRLAGSAAERLVQHVLARLA